MNILTTVDGKLKCSCGAVQGKSKKRFILRHPVLCSVEQEKALRRQEFNRQLAVGTKAVDWDSADQEARGTSKEE